MTEVLREGLPVSESGERVADVPTPHFDTEALTRRLPVSVEAADNGTKTSGGFEMHLLPSDPRKAQEVVQRVETRLVELGWPVGKAGKFSEAVGEAIISAVIQGSFGLNGDGYSLEDYDAWRKAREEDAEFRAMPVTVKLVLGDDEAVAVVRHEGKAFNWRTKKDPRDTGPLSLEEALHRGTLIQRLCGPKEGGAVAFGANQVVLTMNREESPFEHRAADTGKITPPSDV